MGDFHALLYKGVISLRPGETALIVVDMQKGFLDDGAALKVPEGRALIPVINRVIRALRRWGAPVVFTQFVYDPQVPSLFGELHPEHKPPQPNQPTGLGRPSGCCLLGDESAELHPDLERQPSDYVLQKLGYDAFYQTPLDDYLRLKGVRTLMLTGVLTDVCVWHTVSGAVHRNYKVVVLKDAVATLSAEAQRSTLNSLAWSVARILTADQAIAELEAAGK
ncbi:MAG TPA: isochorismatase family cysteine hydrolase [Limnochordia bacterium]|nr:isochorismatase family cysteine hydrolase [Limnochordia bacterium]